MMADLGTFSIETDKIRIEGYPYKPPVAYGSIELFHQNIINIDVSKRPLTVRTGDELIFVPASEIEKLSRFALANQIPFIERDDVWSWLLGPFLDSEYTEETHQKLAALLSAYGLSETQVRLTSKEVAIQMFKYNFDTMLWEWCSLGSDDVLRAMRVKYNSEEFLHFYRRAMSICLLPDEFGNT
ncbi:hypothetical protein SAMN05216327_107355 [Dyadobacter sp. SG02]|nr:hypothetical protein SAMN05216327_107355 [Dyadobacter sp. SG02]